MSSVIRRREGFLFGAVSALTASVLLAPLGAAQAVPANDVVSSLISPDSQRVVYRADQEQDEVFQLYSVPIAGGRALGVSSTPVLGGDVRDYLVSLDSQRVVYRADQDADEVVELYSAAIDGHQPGVKLNGPLADGGDVASFRVATERVVYLANQDSAARTELFSVPLDGGTPVRLNGTLVSGGNVVSYLISPDGKHVVYAADQLTDEVFELFVVPTTGGTPLVLGPLDSWRSFDISPDSQRVVFVSSGLHSVSILGGPASLLTRVPQRPSSYTITPNSRRVLFIAPGDSGSEQLHVVPIAGGTSRKLTEHSGSRVWQVVVSPDSRRVAYSLEGGDAVHSVFSVSLAGGAPVPIMEWGNQVEVGPFSPDGQRILFNDLVHEELHSAPAAGGPSILLAGSMFGGSITPDSQRVVCQDDMYSFYYTNLFSIPLMGGEPVQLNEPLGPGGGAGAAKLSPDGARVVYLADQDYDEVFELFSVPVEGGAVVKLNPPLVGGGSVSAWKPFLHGFSARVR